MPSGISYIFSENDVQAYIQSASGTPYLLSIGEDGILQTNLSGTQVNTPLPYINISGGTIGGTLNVFTLSGTSISGASIFDSGNRVVTSVNSQSGPTVNLTTTNINEGTNLYYTEARVSANTSVSGNTLVIAYVSGVATQNTIDISNVSGVAFSAVQGGSNVGGQTNIFSTKNGTNLEFNTVQGLGIVSITTVGNVVQISGSTSAGTGDVTGPVSSTDNAVALFNGGTGKVIKNSNIVISNSTNTLNAPVLSGTTISGNTATITTINNTNLNGSTGLFTTTVNSPTLSGTTINNDTFNGATGVFSVLGRASVISGTTISGNTLSLAGQFTGSTAVFSSVVNASVMSGTTVSGNTVSAEMVKLITRTIEPTTPDSGTSIMYSRSIAGKIMPKSKGPSGTDYPFQPAIFQNQVCWVSPNRTTSVSVVNMAVTSVGVLSTVIDDTFGYTTNFVSAVSGTCGTGHIDGNIRRGLTTGGANGFFFAGRIGFPDATYVNASGSRVFVGYTAGTMAAMASTDTPTGDFVGFNFVWNGGSARKDTNFQIATRDNVTTTLGNTAMEFSGTSLYDFYLFCPAGSSEIGWRIDNLFAGTSSEGSTSTTIPRTGVNMRFGMQVGLPAGSLATVRNVRLKRLYNEQDL